MVRDETLKVLSILKAAYPNSYKNMTTIEANGVINLWTSHLKNVPGDIVCLAINKLIATSKFPPSIAEVIDKLCSMYYEAVGELLTDNISTDRTEELKRIAYYCKNIKSEPELGYLMSERRNSLEAHDMHKGNMPALQARRQSNDLL